MEISNAVRSKMKRRNVTPIPKRFASVGDLLMSGTPLNQA
jgi:hypothetical protein